MPITGKFEKLVKQKDYIKYIEDYDTELVEDENGKMKKVTTYIGPIIRFVDASDTVKKKMWLSLAFSIITVAILVRINFLSHTTAWFFLTTLTSSIILFPALFLFMSAINLPFSAKEMKRDKYMHSIIRTFRSCGAIIALLAVIFVSEFVYRIINSDWIFLKDDFVFLIYVLLAAGMSVVNIITLRSLTIDETELDAENNAF